MTRVTLTLHVLEGAGMIRSKRGRVIVADRERLEEVAGNSYGEPEAEYLRADRPPSPVGGYRRLSAANPKRKRCDDHALAPGWL